MLKKCLFIMSLAFFGNAFADDKQTFNDWLTDLKSEAKAQHISNKTIKNTFKSARFLPQVIALDRAQPEFITPFLSYMDARITPSKVQQGRELLQTHAALLNQVEAQYGVPRQVIVAFWGMETHYGANKGNFGLPSSLMTLAYEGRRADFFRRQFIEMMRIIDARHSPLAALRGSWAGAFGHMQFMPSTLVQYGVDADADGRINMLGSLPDAFASAANYLAKIGWRKDEAVATEVILPANFDYAQAQLQNRKNSADWAKIGVLAADGRALPSLENTAILLPQGWQGPAFLVASNFDAVLDWNRSVNYALSVSHLADQFLADKPILGGEQAEKDGMTFNQMWALQAKLNALGFDCGEPDGYPGLKTQVAIRQYQAQNNLPQDGYASPGLYQKLLIN